MTTSGPPDLTVGQALRQATQFLSEHGFGDARRTAEDLLCRALNKERGFLYSHPEAPLSTNAWIHFGRWLHERTQGKPLQYILREQEFYGRVFSVNSSVLIPRPETELLVEQALKSPGERILDIGTGSGILAITLALELNVTAYATDFSPAALRVAQANAMRLGAPVRFIQTDLGGGFAEGAFDLIVTNPPYVPAGDGPWLQREVRDWEPKEALFSGADGLDHYRRLEPECRRLLRPGGRLLGEFGFGQSPALRTLFADWAEVTIHEDLARIDRILDCRRTVD